jgi:hypothetical protein
MQLGANSAMQLGLADSALSFYQTVLKFDPEQDRARTQYRGLKKVIKLMDKAEKEVRKQCLAFVSTFCLRPDHTYVSCFNRYKKATIGQRRKSSRSAFPR